MNNELKDFIPETLQLYKVGLNWIEHSLTLYIDLRSWKYGVAVLGSEI